MICPNCGVNKEIALHIIKSLRKERDKFRERVEQLELKEQNRIHAWRLGTFIAGMLVLIAGAMFENLPDWDFWNSVWMAAVTYLVMPSFNRAVSQARLIDAFGLMCLPVVVVYELYNEWAGMPAYSWANFQASTWLFILCWVIWYVAPAILSGRPPSPDSQQKADQHSGK